MRFLVVDDHPLFREVICRYLAIVDSNAEIIEAEVANEAVDAIKRHEPFDLVLLDVVMPGKDGQELFADIVELDATSPVVFVSGHDCPKTAATLLQQGARGYISKSTRPKEFVHALVQVLNGGEYLSPELCGETGGAISSSNVEADLIPAMTPRQNEVLKLLHQGRTNKAIAAELGCSLGTVKLHVAGILRALRVNNRTEAVAAAARYGLVGASGHSASPSG